MTSEQIDAFLTFLRDCEQRFHMTEAEEQEANAVTNDIHHSLELEEHGDGEILQLAKELTQARRQRQKAKDEMDALSPVLLWVEENRSVVKGLERLLGDVCKAERRAENRIYTPRTERVRGSE